MAFDITSVLKTAASTDQKEQIVYLPIDQLDPDPNNFYDTSDVDDLAASIELIGLQQPIRVRPGQDGHYFVVSGHRRRKAIMAIRSQNPEAFRDGVPCIIEYGAASDAMNELRLIYANSATRVISPYEQARQIERVTEILYTLKKQGVSFPGRMRDHVAEACRISETNIARLNKIRKCLVPELMPQFESGKLGVTAAHRIAQEDAAVQKELAKRAGPCIADMNQSTLESAITLAKTPKAEPVASPKFDGHGQLEFDADAYLKEHQEEDDAFFEMLAMVADLFFRALGSLNSRQEGIETLKKRFGKDHYYQGSLIVEARCSPKGLELCKGPATEHITRTWTDVYDMLCTIALNDRAMKTFEEEVSETDTGPQWSTKTPVVGKYAIKYGVPDKETPQTTCEKIARWDGEHWIIEKTGVRIRENVYRWYQIPEV